MMSNKKRVKFKLDSLFVAKKADNYPDYPMAGWSF